jgi:hypothetical protein
MYDQLKSRLAALLQRPRALKPQTERQLAQHLSEHSSTTVPAFLLCARDVLEDYELDILFGPIFTPSLSERAELSELLFHWRPDAAQLARVVKELSAEAPSATVRLPDGTDAPLPLHEVMVERFVRLMRLDNGPDPATAAALRDALPADLWPLAVALLCERGMTPGHQSFFATFVNHMAARHPVTRERLETAAEFIASQPNLGREVIIPAAEALMRATQGTAAYAASGHTYWSPDVAQHHHYRGQGKVDRERLERRQAELEWVSELVDDLKTFQTDKGTG